ncbi:MAG: tandem-95 repeat protein [Pseudomonadota bacterium]
MTINFGKRAEREFEFTSLLGSQILGPGATSLSVGDTFSMPVNASASVIVKDNDRHLSGDFFRNERGDDRSGQIAEIRVGDSVIDDAKIYAEQYHVLRDQSGQKYFLVEIEFVGSPSGDRDDLFTFLGNVPPPEAVLTVAATRNVFFGVRYDALGAGMLDTPNTLSDADEASSLEESLGTVALSNVLANVTDPEPGEPSVSAVNSIPGNVGLSVDGTNGGRFVINADGSATFDDDGDFEALGQGETEVTSVTYTVTDSGGLSVTSSYTVTVTGRNDAPTGQPTGVLAQGVEDTPQVIQAATLLQGFSDVEGDTLQVTDLAAGQGASLVDNLDGTFTFTPGANVFGDVDLTYTVSDGQGGTLEGQMLTLNLSPVEDAPIANNSAVSTDEDTPITTAFDAVDPDGDALTYVIDRQPLNGTVAVGDDGMFTYTPRADFSGRDLFTYTVDDGNGGVDSAEVSLTVTPVNDAPTAIDQMVADGDVDLALFGAIQGRLNVFDQEFDALEFTIESGPTNGSVSIDEDGFFAYTPGTSFSQLDSFVYRVTDENGGTNTATVSVGVKDANPLTLLPDADGHIAVTDALGPDRTIILDYSGLSSGIRASLEVGGNFAGASAVVLKMNDDLFAVSADFGANLFIFDPAEFVGTDTGFSNLDVGIKSEGFFYFADVDGGPVNLDVSVNAATSVSFDGDATFGDLDIVTGLTISQTSAFQVFGTFEARAGTTITLQDSSNDFGVDAFVQGGSVVSLRDIGSINLSASGTELLLVETLNNGNIFMRNSEVGELFLNANGAGRVDLDNVSGTTLQASGNAIDGKIIDFDAIEISGSGSFTSNPTVFLDGEGTDPVSIEIDSGVAMAKLTAQNLSLALSNTGDLTVLADTLSVEDANVSGEVFARSDRFELPVSELPLVTPIVAAQTIDLGVDEFVLDFDTALAPGAQEALNATAIGVSAGLVTVDVGGTQTPVTDGTADVTDGTQDATVSTTDLFQGGSFEIEFV